jgi:hypothetical protein
MKKAIISKLTVQTAGPFDGNTQTFSGWKVCQIENSILFPVGEPNHFWADCPDEATVEEWWYDFNDNTVKKIPLPAVVPEPNYPWLPKKK